MSKKASAIIKLRFPSEEEPRIIERALKPEAKSSPRHRSRTRVTCKDENLTLEFEAEDTTALRASVNSYLSWLQLLNDVYKTLRSHSVSLPSR
ncbi:MAG: KEOPS complex subunit Pcc1 [Nitrososphaerota archaeon]